MNETEATRHSASGHRALPQFSTHPRWPRFPAASLRLKAHPIGRRAREQSVAGGEEKRSDLSPLPSLLSTFPAKPTIDLEEHADYLESP